MTTGPTTIASETNSLATHIRTLGELGSTQQGRDWCLKALHPAEPSIEGIGMPDGTAQDTVKLHATWATTVGPPSGLSGTTWGFDGTLLPHPFVAFELTYDDVAKTTKNLYNPQYTQSTGPYTDLMTAATQAWLGRFERWRLCACSVTVHLDANATKDSGTFVTAQQPAQPNVVFPSNPGGFCHPPGLYWNSTDLPSYDALMQLPKSYQNNAKFGLYVPLKLTNTSQHWRSAKEMISVFNPGTIPGSSTPYENGWTAITTSNTPAYPFWDALPLRFDAGTTQTKGNVLPGFCNDSFAHICCRNVDAGANLVFKFKYCWEAQVQAKTVYSNILSPASPQDELALKMYAMIAREIPDGFDASANDEGKVLRWIGKGLKKAAPYFKFVPHYGGALSTVATTLGSAATYGGKALSTYGKKRKKKAKKQQRKQKAKATPKAKKEKTVFVDATGKEHRV